MEAKNQEGNHYGHHQEEDQGQGDKKSKDNSQVGGFMNLAEAYDLDDKDPKAPYQPSNERNQPPYLGGLRVGYNPESGLKAIFPPFDNEQQ